MKSKLLLAIFFSTLFIFSAGLTTQTEASNVYVFSSGNSTEDSTITSVLQSFGHTPTIGVQYYEFDGTQDISGYNAVLFLANYNWTIGDMPVAGQNALLNYVNLGGGLITSEWVMWKVPAHGDFQTLEPAFPTTSYANYTNAGSTTYTQNVTDPVIDFNLPVSFLFNLGNINGTESQLVAKSGASVFFDTTNYAGCAGLAGWEYGDGRVVNFSTLIALTELGNANYQQLLSNTINWTSGTVVPIPGAVWLLGSGLIGLVGLRRKVRK